MSNQDVSESVKAFYAEASAAPQEELCCPTGYSVEDLESLPEDVTDISYGCGNPVSAAQINPGDVVLDIGSGGGIDCFLAARKVGPEGRVIGLDMTDAMLDKARANAEKIGVTNIEFRKGEAEQIPAQDKSVDLVISNCVINLTADKAKAFGEIFRVLKPGGRAVISDIVATREVPDALKNDEKLWAGCLSGAIPLGEYMGAMVSSGFTSMEILKNELWKTVEGEDFHSVTIRALGKPAGGCCG